MIFDIDVIPNCERIVHTDAELYYYRYNPNSLTTVYKGNRFEKNVELYHEMERRLLKYFRRNTFYDSLSRYLIKIARIAVMQECDFVKVNGLKNALCNIERISKKKELQDVLKSYDWNRLPFKYRIMCALQRRGLALGQLIICCFFKN